MSSQVSGMSTSDPERTRMPSGPTACCRTSIPNSIPSMNVTPQMPRTSSGIRTAGHHRCTMRSTTTISTADTTMNTIRIGITGWW